jgi:membrane-associated HD superfamily phosphohydrolase
MPGVFEPLLKPKSEEEAVGVYRPMESFVTETDTKTVVNNVFASVGLMLLAAVVMWLFYWSYSREKTLYMAIMSGLLFLYTLSILAVTVVYRAKYTKPVFSYLMGSSVFVAFMTLISIVFFSIRAAERMRSASSASSGYAAPAYVPPAVQEYIGGPGDGQ